MPYIVPIQIKPYYCIYCGALFTAATVIHQISTTEPCPVCKENRGNGRCDKSNVEIARETIETFIHSPDLTPESQWQRLKAIRRKFYAIAAEQDDDTASFFFSEFRHPDYDVTHTFHFQINDAQSLEYHLDPDLDIIGVYYICKGQKIDVSNDPDALDFWDRYFETEFTEMLKGHAELI